MKVIVARDYEQMCSFAGHFVVRQVRQKSDIVLGLATGRTMVGFYKDLVDRHRKGECSFAGVRTFNLDEYVNLPESHPASYHSFMRWHFVEQVDVEPTRVHIPKGNSDRLLDAAAEYEALIRESGGIDLQLLGLGKNGHIAFNEPGSSLASRTRVKRLTPETILANADDFGGTENVPRYVMTTGIGTVMEARFLLLLASGAGKARAVEQMVEGPVTSQCPGSILQMHQHAFVVVDELAAVRLSQRYDTVEAVLSDPFEEFFWEM
jgi:glucosamine-6-phosphate deaminase